MSQDFKVDGMPAEDILIEIHAAIENAGLHREVTQGDLELHGVDITLTTVAETEVGAKPVFKVPFTGWEIGGETSQTKVNTHELSMSLRTPWAPEEAEGSTKKQGIGDMRGELPGVVDALRSMLNQARRGVGRLQLQKSSAVFDFNLSRNGKIALAVPHGDKTWGSTIKIVFTFGPGKG